METMNENPTPHDATSPGPEGSSIEGAGPHSAGHAAKSPKRRTNGERGRVMLKLGIPFKISGRFLGICVGTKIKFLS
jgi:hypothetical protein